MIILMSLSAILQDGGPSDPQSSGQQLSPSEAVTFRGEIERTTMSFNRHLLRPLMPDITPQDEARGVHFPHSSSFRIVYAADSLDEHAFGTRILLPCLY